MDLHLERLEYLIKLTIEFCHTVEICSFCSICDSDGDILYTNESICSRMCCYIAELLFCIIIVCFHKRKN